MSDLPLNRCAIWIDLFVCYLVQYQWYSVYHILLYRFISKKICSLVFFEFWILNFNQFLELDLRFIELWKKISFFCSVYFLLSIVKIHFFFRLLNHQYSLGHTTKVGHNFKKRSDKFLKLIEKTNTSSFRTKIMML